MASQWAASLWVGLGGGLGSVGRYWTGVAVARWLGEAFPWGTLLINVLGSFVIGLVATLTLAEGALPAGATARLFVMAGICGGYTTFSAFSLQVLALAQGGQWDWAAGYVALSLLLCLGAVAAGHMLALGFGRAG